MKDGALLAEDVDSASASKSGPSSSAELRGFFSAASERLDNFLFNAIPLFEKPGADNMARVVYYVAHGTATGAARSVRRVVLRRDPPHAKGGPREEAKSC